jgi:hypothetical protein
MSRAPVTFRQSDLTRALKAMKAAGIEGCVKLDKQGNIYILTGKVTKQNVDTIPTSSWDDAIAKLESRHEAPIRPSLR